MSNPNFAAKIELKQLENKHLKRISQIHLDTFPDSSWTKLGSRVVENYYLYQLVEPHPFVWARVAVAGDDCAGFCISGIFRGSTSGFIKKNRVLLARKTLTKPWLLLDPIFTDRLNEGVALLKRMAAREKKQNESPTNGANAARPKYGILAIATAPDFQGLGVGKSLMLDAEATACARGFNEMILTVDVGNANAIRFYENLNWRKSLDDGGEWAGVMTKQLVV